MSVESAESKKNSSDNEILTEMIFHVILENVFTHLNTGDLCRTARVSKLWNETVRREFSRRGPEICVLPFPMKGNDSDSDESFDEEYNQCTSTYREIIEHTDTMLRRRPRAAILFIDDSVDRSRIGFPDPGIETFRKYCDDFSRPTTDLIVVETLGVTVNEIGCIEKGRLPGLLLPAAQTLEYTIVKYDEQEQYGLCENNDDLPHQIVEELLSTTQNHNCIIMFLAPGWYDRGLESFWSAVLSNLKQRYEPGKFSFWGGRVESLTNSCSTGECPPMIYAVSLSGPTKRSWSIVLNCNLPKSETEKQLLTFKTCVCLRPTSVALLFVPTSKENTPEERSLKTEVFKNIFPTVQTLCIFNDEKYPQYGISSTSNIGDLQEVRHMNSIACLIFT